MSRCQNPCILTLFGGTGNLAYKKLIPALYHLFAEDKLPKCFYVLSVGRREYTKETYQESIKSYLDDDSTFDEDVWNKFAKIIGYFPLDFNEESHYIALSNHLKKLDSIYGTKNNRLFYFAVAPQYFELISKRLVTYNLLEDNSGFHRVVFEKPFGKNLETAKSFNRILRECFDEKQIYRIDHYLGKEMIQNILVLRFANRLFEEIWCKNGIEKIHIKALETVGVGKRGGYYDNAGALRDMVQNHLLQILALIAMDPPKNFDTESIRNEKVKVLSNLKLHKINGKSDIVLGQYEGYLKEDQVQPNSLTETYVKLSCAVDTNRWQGVPFILETGKKLDQKKAEIEIYFKPHSSKYTPDGIETFPNRLIIRIQPSEGVFLEMNVKKPGLELEIDRVNMEYCQSCKTLIHSPEAYEKLITDIIDGDSTLFARWDEIEASWTFVDKLLECCSLDRRYLKIYSPGKRGPNDV
ncbi:MAG: glucose-6-phosphate dehydrogenase [Tissierellales bacterium]|jgi:glucose-6-phosphate 1-dehydrogenase|nr:glucose-6-phosphate dehydrogenase [Tissierellales bacterium]